MRLDFNFTQAQEKPQGAIAISLSKMEQEDQAMLNNARILASDITADEAAEIKSLAEKNGTTFEMVKADKVKAKTDALVSKMKEVHKQAPYFSKLLGNKTYMSLCQDDIDNLMKIETNPIEKTWDIARSVVAVAPDMLGGVSSGTWQLAAMLQRGRNKLHQTVSQKALEIMRNNGQEKSRVYSFLEKHSQNMNELTKSMNEFATGTKKASDDTFGALANWIRPEERRQNVATRIAETVGQIGSQVAMGGYGWVAMGLNALDEQQELMREKGIYGTGRGDVASISSAVLEGLIERQALGRYLNKANLGVGLKRRLIRAGVNAGLEGLEEGTQNIATDMIDMYVGGIDKEWSDIAKDAAIATFYATAGAGIFSSAQGLFPSNRTQRRQKRLTEERLLNGERINFLKSLKDKGLSLLKKDVGVVDNDKFKEFEKSGDINDIKSAQGMLSAFADGLTQDVFSEPVMAVQGLTQLGDIADASTTLKRDKATFIETVNKITEQSGTDVVFFDANELQEAFEDASGDLKAVLYQMDISENEFSDALESGGDVSVKTGQYVANISKNEELYEKMNSVARLKEDAPSYREVSKIIQQTRDDIANYQNETQREMTPREESSKQVYENVYQALTGLKISKSEADSIATIWTARANTFTAGKEMMPMDWFNRATRGNLTIMRKGMAAQITSNDRVKLERVPKEKDELIKYIYELRRPIKDKKKLGLSLLEFIGKHGGLKDVGGELKAMDADKWHREKPGRSRLMREDGQDFDDMALSAWENGYFGYGTERPTINEFLEAVSNELSGQKIYAQTSEIMAKQEEIRQREEEFEFMDDIMADYGLSLMRSDVHKLADAFRDYQAKREKDSPSAQTVSQKYDGNEDVFALDDIYYQGAIIQKAENVELSINTAEEMKGMSETDFKQKMLETLWSFKNNKIHNASLRADIEIRTSSIKKYKSFFADKNKRLIVPYIPKLLQKANFSKIEKSYIQEKEPNIKAYYKANIGIDIDDNYHNVYLTVREDNQGNFFWDAQIKEGSQHATPATNPGDTAPININIPLSNKNVNTLYQSAYAGSRIDYDQPSLEAIGSGEGLQVHGWGLYYALNKEVAEAYRQRFTQGLTEYDVFIDGNKISEDKQLLFSNNISGSILYEAGEKNISVLKEYLKKYYGKPFQYLHQDIIDLCKKELERIEQNPKMSITEFLKGVQTEKYRFSSLVDAAKRRAKESGKKNSLSDVKERILEHLEPFERGKARDKEIHDFLSNLDADKISLKKREGQVHEVDIPESPYLLDEQDTHDEQSNFVKQALRRLSMKEKITFRTTNKIPTGRDIYKILSEKLGSDKKASQKLEEYGIKGITYKGARDGRCFVIFNPKDIKVIQKFYQDEFGKANAMVDFTQENRVLMKLFEGANKSSILHESAHIFLRDLISSAEYDATSSRQLEVLKKWFGNGEEITPQNEEKFARAFEKYLMEGKAPSLELQPVFARFRRWLIEIYKTLFGIDRSAGQTINITPEIKTLFDTLIATDEQIKEARRINAQDEVLPQEYFKSKEEYEVYLENLNNANERAFDEVVEKRASAIAKMRERQYLNEYKETLENAKKEVAQETRYQLLTALQKGEVKIDKSAAERYGHNINPNWLSDNGIMPDDLAEDFGFRNGDNMLSELVQMPSINETASQIAGSIMIDRHEELFDELSIKDSAVRAIYNEETINRLAEEEIKIRGERPATKTKDILLKAIQTGGNNIIQTALLGEATNVRKYAKQALKAGEDYEYAIRNKIKHRALDAKHRQAMASYLVKRSYEAETDVRKAEKFFNEIKGREKIVGTRYFEQIKNLLAKHGFWDVDFQPVHGFNEFMEGLKQNGETLPIVNPTLLDTTHSNYWKMSYGDFMSLYDAVKSIYTVGRNSRIMMKKASAETIENAAKRLSESIYAKTSPTKTTSSDMLKEPTNWERFVDKLKKLESWLVKTEQVCLELDGGKQGIFSEEFYKRMSNAETETALELKEVDVKLADIFKDYDASILAMKYQIGQKEMTFKQILMLGMNWGNEGNRQAILNSPYGLNEFHIRQALAKLRKSDWDNIQKVWDLMESYRDRSFDLEERMTGVRPKAVEPTVVHTVFGDYKGGYFPIAFDPEKSSIVEDREIRRAMDNQFSNPQFRRITNRGFLKSRQGSIQPVLLNDLNIVKKHFVDLITDLNYREAKIDMVRLLRNEELKKAIQSRIGKHGFEALQKWVLDSGLKQIPIATPDRILDTLRINAVKFSMAGNVKVMATQFSGLGATMSEVGGKNTLRWIGHYVEALSSGKLKDYGKFILSRSKFMQLRSQELDRDLKDFYNKNYGKSKANIIIDEKVEFLLKGIQKMDFIVSSISWRAGYEKAILEGQTEEQAIDYADSVVRLTQGSGRGVDQSRIQRENSTWKMITSFYSVFNVLYNRYRRAIRDIQLGRGYQRLIQEAIYTWFVQSALESLIRWLFDTDKKKNRHYVSHLAEQAISQLFAVNPLTFYASSAIGRIAGGENAGTFGASPIAFGVYDSATRSIQNLANGNIGKGLKNIAEGVGMGTGVISRAEINVLEAMLNQVKEGYFDPVEYISGVKKK